MPGNDADHDRRQRRYLTMTLLTLILLFLITAAVFETPAHEKASEQGDPSSGSSSEADRFFAKTGTAGSCNPFPFVPATATSMRISAKKAFAFYFPPFPVSEDNRDPSNDDYSHWVKGEGAYQLVDRPVPRAPINSSQWLQQDFQTEVRRAIDVGLDGFIWEYGIGTPDPRWHRLPLMLAAARAVDPGFRVMLSPAFPSQPGASPDAVVSAIQQIKNDPNLFRLPNGRLVLAPFAPERQPVEFWSSLIQKLAAQGTNVAFVPIFLAGGQSYMSAWAGSSYGFSTWGNRWPSGAASYAAGATDSHARNRIYMSPVSFEDVRTRIGRFFESSGSSELRASLMSAINGKADWISFITWNDYTESWVSPSVNRGYAVTDVAAYYIQWFKQQTPPSITQDVLYYFHRTQTTDAPAQDSSANLARMTLAAGDPAENRVEFLAFLTSPGTLTMTQGDQVWMQTAPKGVTAFKVKMVPGTTPVFSLQRSGKTVIRLASSSPIQQTVTRRDLSYHAGSSSKCNRP